jgi:ribonucleoside-diphosphate reductase alpha chain
MAKSIVDYIFRWLEMTFPDGTVDANLGGKARQPAPALAQVASVAAEAVTAAAGARPAAAAGEERVDGMFSHFMEDAPVCDLCGSITVRNGACYRCFNCGNSMGCS